MSRGPRKGAVNHLKVAHTDLWRTLMETHQVVETQDREQIDDHIEMLERGTKALVKALRREAGVLLQVPSKPVTEEPPVGARVKDRHGRLWEGTSADHWAPVVLGVVGTGLTPWKYLHRFNGPITLHSLPSNEE